MKEIKGAMMAVGAIAVITVVPAVLLFAIPVFLAWLVG